MGYFDDEFKKTFHAVKGLVNKLDPFGDHDDDDDDAAKAKAKEAPSFPDDGVKDALPPSYIKYPPTKEMTGVSPFMTRLCATISADTYNTENKETDFSAITEIGTSKMVGSTENQATTGGTNNEEMDSCQKYSTLADTGLQTQPEILLYENNGVFQPTNPPCVVVVADQTMIIGWRGSATAMDWDRDFGFYTSSSFRWQNVAKVVKVQGAYISMIEEFMITNEALILTTIKERNITEIILTGHSLAGGVAQVGHLWIAGSMNANYRPSTSSYPQWEALYGTVTVRTIAFEAPMTTVYLPSTSPTDAVMNAKGIAFIQSCGATMCTTCYQMDFIPHGYGEPKWALDVIQNMIDVDDEEQAGEGLLKKGLNKGFFHILDRRLNQMLIDTTKKDAPISPYVKCAKMFQHIGKIIHYETNNAPPKVYIDDITTVVNNSHVNNGLQLVDFFSTRTDGNGTGTSHGSTGTLLPKFSTMKYIPSGDSPTDVVNIEYRNHEYIITGPGLSLSWQAWFAEHQTVV